MAIGFSGKQMIDPYLRVETPLLVTRHSEYNARRLRFERIAVTVLCISALKIIARVGELF